MQTACLRHAVVWVGLVLWLGCDENERVSKRVDTPTRADAGESLQPLPPDLSAGIRKIGDGLPLSVTPAAYRRLIQKTRLVHQGRFVANVGPAVVQARFDANRLNSTFDLVVVVGPLPNMVVASHSPTNTFELSVREVVDARGRNLLDETAMTNDASYVSLRLAPEPPPEFSPRVPPRARLEVGGYEVPGQPRLAYGARTIPLLQLASAGDIRGITGTLLLKVPLGVTLAELDGANVDRKAAKYRITGGVNPSDPTKVAFSIPTGSELYVDHVALSPEGRVLEPESSRRIVRDGTSILEVTCGYKEKVASVRVAMADTFATIDENFTISP